jgi:predicted GIY-YIG superfamily endonuclease
MAGYVYGVIFSPPYKHAQAYLGSTRNLKQRYREHISGSGSPLIRAAVKAGHECRLVAVRFPRIAEARQMERKLKRWHNNTKSLQFLQALARAS